MFPKEDKNYERKKGAGGKSQPYDSKGRYCSTHKIDIAPNKISKKEKARNHERDRLNVLRENIILQGDQDALKVFDELIRIFKKQTYKMQKTCAKYTDPVENKERELDIETEKCIIEVKRKGRPKCLAQCIAQQNYSKLERKGKPVIVYDEIIRPLAKKALIKNGITVITNLHELRNYMEDK